MKRYHLLLLAVAGAPLLVHAEPVHTSTAAMDANATVPQLHYQSAFAEYKSVEEPQATADNVWVRSNQQVSGQESSGDSETMPMQMNHAPAVQGKPAAVRAADPHKGHNMNMKGH
jgi:hypothetical protein